MAVDVSHLRLPSMGGLPSGGALSPAMNMFAVKSIYFSPSPRKRFLTLYLRVWQKCGKLRRIEKHVGGMNGRRRKSKEVLEYYLYFAAVSQGNPLVIRPEPGL